MSERITDVRAGDVETLCGTHSDINCDNLDCAVCNPKPESDPVYQPHHYARFIIEPITFINANKLPYNIGNVIKYACRYDAKNGVEDLEKARRYLDIQIECLKRDAAVADGADKTETWKVAL